MVLLDKMKANFCIHAGPLITHMFLKFLKRKEIFWDTVHICFHTKVFTGHTRKDVQYIKSKSKNRPTERLLRQGEKNPRVRQTYNHSLGKKVHNFRTMNEV